MLLTNHDLPWTTPDPPKQYSHYGSWTLLQYIYIYIFYIYIYLCSSAQANKLNENLWGSPSDWMKVRRGTMVLTSKHLFSVWPLKYTSRVFTTSEVISEMMVISLKVEEKWFWKVSVVVQCWSCILVVCRNSQKVWWVNILPNYSNCMSQLSYSLSIISDTSYSATLLQHLWLIDGGMFGNLQKAAWHDISFTFNNAVTCEIWCFNMSAAQY